MKIKFGAIVVAGSGKIGGHVASKNRSGAYLRTKVTPTNPNTASQAGARSLLASLSTAWSGLTESQRLGWNNAVKDYATTDIFGDIKNPSGINLFVKLNANLSISGQPLINDAPAKTEVPFEAISVVLFDVSTPALSAIAFFNTGLDGATVLISATPKVSAGTSFVKNQFRNIAVGVPNAGEVNFGTEYVTKFGTLVIGDKFYVKVEPIMPNGQKGTAQTHVCIATA